MQSKKRNRYSRSISRAFLALLATVALSSCERIFEDLAPCPHGVSLRFVYDYNMEYANAFPAQVDCLTLYIYDDEDNYVDTRIVTGTELQDENYRMTLDLEEGDYHFVAYGGMACEQSSFSLQETPKAGSKRTGLSARMDADCLTTPERRRLHDMFWGQLTLRSADLYREGTVKMMKNTNSIRIVLQQVTGGTVKAEDFNFEITDDNTLFSYDNDLLPNGNITYTPWAKGQAQTGVSIVGPDQVVPQPVEVAYAELSTSRLMTKNAPPTGGETACRQPDCDRLPAQQIPPAHAQRPLRNGRPRVSGPRKPLDLVLLPAERRHLAEHTYRGERLGSENQQCGIVDDKSFISGTKNDGQ